jgi:hypothetical protein
MALPMDHCTSSRILDRGYWNNNSINSAMTLPNMCRASDVSSKLTTLVADLVIRTSVILLNLIVISIFVASKIKLSQE